MKTQWIIGALAALAMACGSNENQGRVAMEVAVSGLTAEQNFCFTWQMHQLNAEGEWYLVDEMKEEICGAQGDDTEDAFGTCYGDQRFLITYNVSFYNAGALVSTAAGTSGGGDKDVCVKNYDTPSNALFQFGNEGNVGGVNPGIEVDQVCANDKLQLEDGKVVSALWLQGDTCGAGAAPDSYCALGEGIGVKTVRFGVTDDNVRYVFSEVDPNAGLMNIWWLVFENAVPAETLILQHNPWALGHRAWGGSYYRWDLPYARVAYRYDAPEGVKVGFLYFADGSWAGEMGIDTTGDCNGGLVLDSRVLGIYPDCDSGANFLGAVPRGGSAFDMVFQCIGGGLTFVACDAQSAEVCPAATTARAVTGPVTTIN